MAKKVYVKLGTDIFVGGVEKCKRGMAVYAPSNYFGIVVQNGVVYNCFNDSVKLSAIKGLKMPFFGVANDVRVLFAPYGFSEQVLLKDEEIVLKNGKKVKMNFSATYSVEIEKPSKMVEVRNVVPHSSCMYFDSNGGFVIFNQWRNVLKNMVIEAVKQRAEKGERYIVDESLDKENEGKIGYEKSAVTDLDVAMDVNLQLRKIFERIGYKLKDYNWKRMSIIEIK